MNKGTEFIGTYDPTRDLHRITIWFTEKQMEMLEELTLARSDRPKEQKGSKVLKDALEYYYDYKLAGRSIKKKNTIGEIK